jgi:membrane protein required for colicin V production
MAIVDIIVFSVVLLSLVFGGFRGLVKEALSLAFWVIAAVLASMFSIQAGEAVFGTLISSPALQRVAGFLLVFVVTVFAGGLVSNGLSKLMSKAGLGGVDRALGALFGIIRGIVIVTLVVAVTAQMEWARGWYDQSTLVPYLLVLAQYFQNLLGLADSTATAV